VNNSTPEPDAAPDYWRIKQAFDALLDLDARAQATRLDQLDRDDPALALVLRKRLLRLRAETEYLGSGAATEPVTPDIAGFEVIRAAGTGGMGRVWQVRRTSQPEQLLALKQVHREQLDENLRRRFEQERSVLARLNHPNIVSLVDAGVDSTGHPYLVTPWIEGQRIDGWCTDHQPSVKDRVRLVRDLVMAIAHAHAQLIVHRDLKPANVLVDTDGHVRVLDFGIAKLLDDTDRRAHQTTAGFSLMTLRYAAPEQVAQSVIGPACDLYSIGVLLYELIAGVSPYLDADSPAALTLAITQQQPAAPSRRTDSLCSGSNAADLDAIVLKLLRKDPADRYGSAQELVADLDRWLDGDVVLARSDERGYLLKRWLWRWRLAFAALAVLPVLLGWHLWRLDAQLAETERQRDRARSVADYFVMLFRNADPGEAREGDITARALLESSAAALREPAAGTDAGTRSLLQFVTARVYTDLGMIAEAEPLLAQSIATMQQESPPPVDDLLDAYRTHAAVLYQLDRVADSLKQSQSALALLESMGETRTERYAGMLQNAAIGEATLGQQEKSDATLAKALDVLATHHPDSRAHALLLLNLGGDLASRLDHAGAMRHYERAERAAAALSPPDRDLWLTIRRGMLSAAIELETDPEALLVLRQSIGNGLTDAEAYYGKDHLETAFWYELAGMVAMQTSDPVKALDLFDTSSTIAGQLLEDVTHPFVERFTLNALLARFSEQPEAEDLRSLMAYWSRDLQARKPEAPEIALLDRLLESGDCSKPDSLRPTTASPASAGETSPSELPAWQRRVLESFATRARKPC